MASHRNYPSLQYYGTGPDRPKALPTTYRLEDTSTGGILAVEPFRGVKIGASLGYLSTNAGPGSDKRFTSAETVFEPAAAPGIDQQTNYFCNSIYAQYDSLDDPLGMTKKGGNYVMQYSWFHDQKLAHYSYRRMDIKLHQLIALLNKTRLIALRAKTTLTETDRSETADSGWLG